MILDPTLSHLPELNARFPRVSIIGIGNEGNDILSRVFEGGGSGAQCVAVNTDNANLEHVYCHERVSIGGPIADNSGVSNDCKYGEETIQECVRLITPLLTGADVAFIIATAAELGDLRTAAATATVARQVGAVTVGITILPSDSQRDEGLIASRWLALMRQSCNTLAIVDHNRLAQLSEYSFEPVHDLTDQLVIDTVSSLSEALTCPSAINIQLQAFRDLMTHGGIAHIGIAHSSSALRIEEATIGALRGPMLHDNIARCHGALMSVRGDSSLTIEEAERAGQLVAERAGWNVPVVMGTLIDESSYEGCQVSILLTGGVYPQMPGGYRRLPLDMDEMEPDGEGEGPVNLELDLDQLE